MAAASSYVVVSCRGWMDPCSARLLPQSRATAVPSPATRAAAAPATRRPCASSPCAVLLACCEPLPRLVPELLPEPELLPRPHLHLVAPATRHAGLLPQQLLPMPSPTSSSPCPQPRSRSPSPGDPSWTCCCRRLASAARLPGAAFSIAVKLPLLLLLVLQKRAEPLPPNPARLRPFSGQVRCPMAGSAVACSSIAAAVPATPASCRHGAAAVLLQLDAAVLHRAHARAAALTSSPFTSYQAQRPLLPWPLHRPGLGPW
nr:predicted GPI-anchored protein 58 [Aegilops tauschii subsp. strangulata]